MKQRKTARIHVSAETAVCLCVCARTRARAYEFMHVCKMASYIYSPDFIVCSSVILFLYVCVYTSALCVKHLGESVSTHASTCDCVFAAITVCPYMCLHRDTVCHFYVSGCVYACMCLHFCQTCERVSSHTSARRVCVSVRMSLRCASLAAQH